MVLVEVARGLLPLDYGLGGGSRYEEGVGAGRHLQRRAVRGEQPGELAAGEPAGGVRHAVVGAVETPDARFPQADDAARAHHSHQLADRRLGRRDRPVAQHRHAEHGVERRVGERQPVGVCGNHTEGIVPLAEQPECGGLEVGDHEIAVLAEPGAGRTGPAADVEEPPARRQSIVQQLAEQGSGRAVPPVAILDVGHAAVLVELHRVQRPPSPP
jgi:hypothetical protein